MFAEQVHTDGEIHLVHRMCHEVGDAGRRLLESNQQLLGPRRLPGPLHNAREWRTLCWCTDPLPDGCLREPEWSRQRVPGIGFGLRGDAHNLKRRSTLACEVREVCAQDSEEGLPAIGVAFELVIP